MLLCLLGLLCDLLWSDPDKDVQVSRIANFPPHHTVGTGRIDNKAFIVTDFCFYLIFYAKNYLDRRFYTFQL